MYNDNTLDLSTILTQNQYIRALFYHRYPMVSLYKFANNLSSISYETWRKLFAEKDDEPEVFDEEGNTTNRVILSTRMYKLMCMELDGDYDYMMRLPATM